MRLHDINCLGTKCNFDMIAIRYGSFLVCIKFCHFELSLCKGLYRQALFARGLYYRVFIIDILNCCRSIKDFQTNGTVKKVETLNVDAENKYSIYHHL